MRYGVIINSESGSGFFKDAERQERLKGIFTNSGHEAEIRIVAPEDLNRAMREMADSQTDALLIGGGDGTITSAANLLKGTGKVLGVIPLGTFNLEARDLDIDLDPFEAVEQLLVSEITEIDLLSVNDECCLCATVIGFYPALAESREDFHGRSWWTKSVRIVREIATVAVNSPALDLEISENGKTIRRRTRLAAFSPGRYVESIGLIPDREDLASGLLSAYVSEHLSRPQMLKAAFGFLAGRLFGTEEMTLIESTEITINIRRKRTIPAMIDGEILNIQMPCRLRILPRALKVLRPGKPTP